MYKKGQPRPKNGSSRKVNTMHTYAHICIYISIARMFVYMYIYMLCIQHTRVYTPRYAECIKTRWHIVLTCVTPTEGSWTPCIHIICICVLSSLINLSLSFFLHRYMYYREISYIHIHMYVYIYILPIAYCLFPLAILDQEFDSSAAALADFFRDEAH